MDDKTLDDMEGSNAQSKIGQKLLTRNKRLKYGFLSNFILCKGYNIRLSYHDFWLRFKPNNIP